MNKKTRKEVNSYMEKYKRKKAIYRFPELKALNSGNPAYMLCSLS